MSEFKASDFKLDLIKLVCQCIDEQWWHNDTQAALKLGTSRGVISHLRSRTTGHCSTSKLISMLDKMGYQTEIKITRIES